MNAMIGPHGTGPPSPEPASWTPRPSLLWTLTASAENIYISDEEDDSESLKTLKNLAWPTQTQMEDYPAVSVINSRVSGQEGGSVSVQCLYSSKYKNEKREWCRFKDWRCFSGGRTDTSQNSAVLVTDYGKGSVNVEMRGLQKSDAGWYWFSAGDVGVTVHLNVTKRPSTTTAVTTVSVTEKTSINEITSGSTTVTTNTETTTAMMFYFVRTDPPAVTASEKEHDTSKSGKIQDTKRTAPSAGTASEKVHDTSNSEKNQNNNENTMLIWVLLTVGLGLLLILATIITWMLTKKCNGNQTEIKGRVSNSAVHTQAPTTESSVIYSTVICKNKKSSSALDHENDVIYSSVTTTTKKKTLSQALGDDEVIYSSVVLE
ncbi:hypothetical protein AOLI_G00214460 [Acnodon oligacanthus]